MKYDIPMEFYPSPVKLAAGQRRRIRSLVEKQLAGEKVYNVMPQRSLIPILILLTLCVGIGFTTTRPQVKEIITYAVSQVTEFFGWTDETLPETETTEKTDETVPEETIRTEEEETDTTTPEGTVVKIGADTVVGDIRLTVSEAIRSQYGLYFHLELEHLTDTFAGDILQFDTLSLAFDEDPTDIYKNTDPWLDLITLQWGETGILAGEVFTLLDRETSCSAVSYWLFMGTDRPETGRYRLQIGRLFGCDTSSVVFDCTEYGDFEVIFTLDSLPEMLSTTRLTPASVFSIGEIEYTLSSIEIAPLSLTVEITCSRDVTFSPKEYPDVQLTPIYKLYGMFDVIRDLELVEPERSALYEQQFELIPSFRPAVEYTASWHSSSFHREDATEDTVFYTFTMEEPISPDVLQELVLRKMNGGQSLVIWEEE